MKVLLTITVALVLAGTASADNYGGVSAGTRQQVLKELARYPGWSVSRMSCIVARESGFNPRAVNWRDANGGSHGLGQINGVHRYAFRDVWHLRYTIRGGVQMMYRLWRAAGYSPWASTRHGC